MISRTLEFIMASLSPQVAPKSELNPKFFKSCLKLLDFSKRLLKNCSFKIQLLPGATFAIYHKTDAVDAYITRLKQYYRAF